jgi:hypothetical protein
VGLGGAGGSAAAVAARAAAQQYHHVAGYRASPGGRFSPAPRPPRRRSPCAWRRSRGGTARDLAGGQADLVAVGGIARRRGGTSFRWGSLPSASVPTGAGGRRAGDAHGLDRRRPGRRAGRGWRRRCRWPRRRRALSPWGGCGSRF